jgi:hypothetical protein
MFTIPLPVSVGYPDIMSVLLLIEVSPGTKGPPGREKVSCHRKTRFHR